MALFNQAIWRQDLQNKMRGASGSYLFLSSGIDDGYDTNISL